MVTAAKLPPSAEGATPETKAPTEDMAELIGLIEDKRNLEAELRDLAKRIGEVEPRVAEWMLQSGVQNVRLGAVTVYKSVMTSASVKADRKREAVEAARGLGLEDLVVLQPQSFAAWCRERLAEPGSTLPAELADCVNVYETVRVNVRKA